MSLVSNVKVYDLEESIIASGYPMRTVAEMRPVEEKDITRCINLSNACNHGNGAHGQYLTGIRVAFDLRFSNKAWVEAERYRFFEFVSSQSTMHRVAKFDIKSQCNKYVTNNTIKEVERLKAIYLAHPSAENYLILLYNLPSGFELTARMTTNYRCLKNIYIQRKNHRLPEWKEFCEWMETLPMFKELCLGGDIDES